MKHRFAGLCPCGSRHRVRPRHARFTPSEMAKPKPHTGPVKASPVVVRLLREAVAIARAEGDHIVRCGHIERAMGRVAWTPFGGKA